MAFLKIYRPSLSGTSTTSNLPRTFSLTTSFSPSSALPGNSGALQPAVAETCFDARQARKSETPESASQRRHLSLLSSTEYFGRSDLKRSLLNCLSVWFGRR